MKIKGSYRIVLSTIVILISGCLGPDEQLNENAVDAVVEHNKHISDAQQLDSLISEKKSLEGKAKKDSYAAEEIEGAVAEGSSDGDSVEAVNGNDPVMNDEIVPADTLVVEPAAESGVAEGGQPPIADAGDDITVTATLAGCTAKVDLDASNSIDPDGGDLTYEWIYKGNVYTGAQPVIPLTIGRHWVHLTVMDSDLMIDTGMVVVTVDKCALTGGVVVDEGDSTNGGGVGGGSDSSDTGDGTGSDTGGNGTGTANDVIEDTHIGHIHGGPNQNHGGEEHLLLQGSGVNQNVILLNFDMGSVPEYMKVKTASISLAVSKPSVGCGGNKGVETAMHRMTTPWIEGDGVFNTYNGSGSGATYNCLQGDTDISNNQFDCSSEKWKGEEVVYEEATGNSVIITRDFDGIATYDVTGDFEVFPEFGWMLRNENQNACNISFYSSEGAPEAQLQPVLLIEYDTRYF